MAKWLYTQVMDIPKNTERWYHKKHRELIAAGNPDGLNNRIKELVADKGATMNVDVVDLENGKIRVTIRSMFNSEADKDAYNAFVQEFEAERSAYETANGITHSRSIVEQSE